MDDDQTVDSMDEMTISHLKNRLVATELQLSELRFQHDKTRAELLANSAVIRVSFWNRVLGRIPILRAAQILWDDCGPERREFVVRTFDDEDAKLSYFVHEMIYHQVSMYGRLQSWGHHKRVRGSPRFGQFGWTHSPGMNCLISKSQASGGAPIWLEVYVRRIALHRHLQAMRGIEGKFVEMWAALRREE